MARESCNLDKDEAEILKPSSSSSSPPPPSPPTSASSPPALFLKPPQDHHPIQRPENPDVTNSYTQKLEEQSQQQPQAEPGTGSEAPTANPGISICAQKRKDEDAHQPPVRFTNRCSSCQRKVGLTAFRCRCGDLFCARHRYSDTHDCSFDYKAAGREEIAKANPVIRAAKIIKI